MDEWILYPGLMYGVNCAHTKHKLDMRSIFISTAVAQYIVM